MTLIASILFLSALAASVLVIAATVNGAMSRIIDVIEAEFAPALKTERRISFGPVKQRQAARTADVVAFPSRVRSRPEYKLAA
jgi:hypothetical protein